DASSQHTITNRTSQRLVIIAGAPHRRLVSETAPGWPRATKRAGAGPVQRLASVGRAAARFRHALDRTTVLVAGERARKVMEPHARRRLFGNRRRGDYALHRVPARDAGCYYRA